MAATLALVFAMSGGALAARHYVLNSTKQINPKVLKTLKGKNGATGVAGPVGPQGPKGEPGVKGEPGAKGEPGQSALVPLPSGQSESGEFGIRTDNTATSLYIDDSVTFPVRLAAPIPSLHTVYTTISAPVAHCGGPGQAEPGYLCLYSAAHVGVETPPAILDPEGSPIVEGTGRFGFDLEWKITEADGYDDGTYTVTAP